MVECDVGTVASFAFVLYTIHKAVTIFVVEHAQLMVDFYCPMYCRQTSNDNKNKCNTSIGLISLKTQTQRCNEHNHLA